jgi:polyisoprenoid-binding protein YceI
MRQGGDGTVTDADKSGFFLDMQMLDDTTGGIDEMSTAIKPEVNTSTWQIDPVHSTAQFKVKHMMISNVKGEFTAISGTLERNDTDITKSKIEASIDATTINTREPQRDAHLKSADFLETEKHPVLTFKSTSISKQKSGHLTVNGDLTIHGVTRNVVFDVEAPSAPQKDPWGHMRIGFSATTQIKRKDFGLTWNTVLETGGILVGEEVTITLDVEFVK